VAPSNNYVCVTLPSRTAEWCQLLQDVIYVWQTSQCHEFFRHWHAMASTACCANVRLSCRLRQAAVNWPERRLRYLVVWLYRVGSARQQHHCISNMQKQQQKQLPGSYLLRQQTAPGVRQPFSMTKPLPFGSVSATAKTSLYIPIATELRRTLSGLKKTRNSLVDEVGERYRLNHNHRCKTLPPLYSISP